MIVIKNAKNMCRAGVFSALYIVLTCIFLPFAFGPIQVRPAEALCLLPLFYGEAVPALFLGCLAVNLIGGSFDFFIGALITLFASICTYAFGKGIKNHVARVIVGGIPPVLFNAGLLPLVFIFFTGASDGGAFTLYLSYFGSLLLSQMLWVYGLGAPTYAFLHKMRKKGTPSLL